jgi:hypothetical protein
VLTSQGGWRGNLCHNTPTFRTQPSVVGVGIEFSTKQQHATTTQKTTSTMSNNANAAPNADNNTANNTGNNTANNAAPDNNNTGNNAAPNSNNATNNAAPNSNNATATLGSPPPPTTLHGIGNVAPTLVALPPTTLHDIVSFTFEEGHGMQPHPWQKDYISQVLWGSSIHSGVSPRPFFICRSTGGGKSACRNTLGFIRGGVTLTIVPLLSLGADQTAKLQSFTAANQLLPVQLYHLDEYRARDAN